MLIRKTTDLTHADVTPKSVYLDRRRFLRAMGFAGATAMAGRSLFELATPAQTILAGTKFSGLAKSPFSTTEKQNSYDDVTHYNNFYEFGTDKSDPAKNSKNFNTSNWTVSVEGEVVKPRKFTMDEAMNPLTLLCVGMYGETLPNQDGAPMRMVIPWKYGFKSIKSLVKIKFQQKMPPTTWNLAAPGEYGFYSNVNPSVDHPRWAQSKERRLGEIFKRPTLMFNGYGDQVASLYNGMDLKKNY